jgi:hypothetical protein
MRKPLTLLTLFGLGRAQLAVYRPATAEFFLRDDLGRATRILTASSR